MKKLFIVQHVANEGAGTILRHLDAQRIPYETVRLYAGDPLPAPGAVAAAVILGGPMNVDDEAKHPFLKPENEFVKTLAEGDVPLLGICLGAQLIAKALGKRVYKAVKPEIGWHDVMLTAEGKRDTLFSAAGEAPLRVLQWHEDTFDVPEGAALLAAGRDVPNQAFRYKNNVYGLQFHLEADRRMIEDWFKGREDAGALLSEYDNYREKLHAITDVIYARFFGGAGARLTEGTCRESR